ncbi:trypsin [Holotrichia oblita]|nr:trypsin [Holotrichia oblita]
MVSKIIACFIFCLAASVRAETAELDENPKSRVVGGLQAKQEQFPYQAQIKWKGDSTYQYLFCGASIIHQRYVLTAARCVFNKWPSELYVTVGSVVSEWGWHIDVQRVILRDPYYEWDGPSDVALVELMWDITFEVEISPISYISGINQPEVVNASGFGWPSFAGEVSPALQYVTLNTISNEECAKYWGSRITADKICTMPKEGKGTCGKDAGGPLAFYGLQIGIIGWTDFECDSGKPDVHTRVAPYANWISNIINGRFNPACSEYTRV